MSSIFFLVYPCGYIMNSFILYGLYTFQEIKIKIEVMFEELYSPSFESLENIEKICLHFHHYIKDAII